jgi:ADP-ribosylglycohydrolase
VIFGHAFGDAIGLGTEFLSKLQVNNYYPNGLETLNQIVRDAHRRRWKCGDWTDDTDQMICILDSLLSHGKVDVLDIAGRIYQWAADGGMGIGETVLKVVGSPDFLKQPHSVSERVWLSSGRQAAANGAVMRTSVLGIWQNETPEKVKKNAEAVCKITHYDPRCVASCVVVCLAISSLLRETPDASILVDSLAKEADTIDLRVREYIEKAMLPDITVLALDETNAIGYTLKAMAAGIWALLHPTSYRDGIISVIHEGGDADTNAAVAGAILGARFGFSGIPRIWVDSLLHRSELDARVDSLLTMI